MNHEYSYECRKTDLVTFETVDTMSLKSGVEDRRILQSDRGHIPLVDETDVVHIYEEQIESRKKKIQNCRERMGKLDSVDHQKRREVEYSFTLTEDDVQYGYGDVYDIYSVDDRVFNARIVGYRLSWEDPRTSSRANMSRKIKCRINYTDSRRIPAASAAG